jgi:catechol 2,3-dioxygenase-like lactoylglutathione lyase family enzyme
MSIGLDHTVVRVRDERVAADFLAEVLGLPVGAQTGTADQGTGRGLSGRDVGECLTLWFFGAGSATLRA